MTKFRRNESMNVFRDHVDPEKEEQQKQIIIETDAKVERIVKLVKSVNSGNKDAKQRKRSEAIHLIEDFYKQYQSMCDLYEDLREGVKKKFNNEEDKEDNESTSSSYSLSMESAAYYSPGSGSKTPIIDQPKLTTTDGQSMKSENSCYSLEALSVDSSYKEAERGRTVENKIQNLGNKSPSSMKVLEDKIIALKLEIEALNYQKGEHEQEFKGRHDEFHKRLKENSGVQLQFAFKEKEGEVLKKLDECEKFFDGKIEECMNRVQNLEMGVDYLRSQNENFSHEKEQELESLRIQNQESEFELSKKTKEASDTLEVLESLTEKLRQKAENEEGLVEERDALKQQVKDLEIKIETINDENRLSKYENENKRTTISQLQEKLQEKDSQISTLESEIEGVKRDLSNKMKSLEQKYNLLEIDKRELEGKNDVLAASLEQREMQVNKLNLEASSSFRATVKKMGEMVDEFKKKSEDSIRILSRRIRVAEQLHNETREWYQKTREKNEQDRKDSELAFHSIKIIMSMVSDTLSISETFGLRFVECCEAFTNRVSKVSCEINYVKDWMKRKNGALVQVKKDFDELVVQLDDKEKEILGSRQKVLKLESKLRDLEKVVKEDDETMIVLKEEKREAIRQLCVWIDHHRGRSDFLKKAFSELVARYQRPG